MCFSVCIVNPTQMCVCVCLCVCVCVSVSVCICVYVCRVSTCLSNICLSLRVYEVEQGQGLPPPSDDLYDDVPCGVSQTSITRT